MYKRHLPCTAATYVVAARSIMTHVAFAVQAVGKRKPAANPIRIAPSYLGVLIRAEGVLDNMELQ